MANHIKDGDRMAKIDTWREKYQTALSAYESNRENFKLWQKQFDGSKEIPHGNVEAGITPKPATSVYNFTRELIEAQIDSNIPQPAVQPKKPTERNRELADIITSMLRNELDRLPFEQLNDLDERITRIMSGSAYLVEWDNNQKTDTLIGQIDVKLITPLDIIPQELVYNTGKMDYFFLTFEDTKKRLAARYGKNLSEGSVDPKTGEIGTTDERATQVIVFYRNSEKIGCFSWAGDTVLVDDTGYFSRKGKMCAKCGKVSTEKICACGSNQFVKQDKDFETLMRDIVLSDGRMIPANSPAQNENGDFVMEDYTDGEQEIDAETGYPVYERIFADGLVIGDKPVERIKQRNVFEPTKIPYYTPRDFPIAVRRNVSAYQQFFGDSDCAAIRDQQIQANKAMTKIDSKIASTSEFFTKPEKLTFKMMNDGVTVLDIENPADIAMIKAISLQFDAGAEYATIERAYYQAKSLLGVSDTFQGKADPTATSGKAKEIQVAQAAGIQKSKRVMKNAAYAKLFEIMFQFMLAYADEPRTYTSQDENGQQVEKIFNRYDFLEQDEHGNWHYNDEFLFSVDEAGAMQTDKQFLLQDVRTDFGMGAFGAKEAPETMLMYWKEKAVLGYPNAKRMVNHWQAKVDAANEAAEMQQMIAQQMPQQMPPMEANTGVMM